MNAMSELDIWLVIVLLALSTLLTRSGFWLLGTRVNLPKRVMQALRYAPACALAAILAPDFLVQQQQINLSLHNPHWVAGVLATLFFYYRRNMLLTIGFGMAVYTCMRLYA